MKNEYNETIFREVVMEYKTDLDGVALFSEETNSGMLV